MVIITSMRVVVAVLATILMWSIYQRTITRRSTLTPVTPQRNPPTQDVPPLFVDIPPARGAPRGQY